MSLPPDFINLVDKKGTLMNLSKVEDAASELSSKYPQERQHYIFIRVVPKFLVETAQLSLWAKKGLLWGEAWRGALFSSHLDTARSSKEAEASSDEALELSLCLSKGCSREEGTLPGQNHLPQLQAFSLQPGERLIHFSHSAGRRRKL